MIKILIQHMPNTLNYGSMMMGENFILYIKNELGRENVEFVIETPFLDKTKKRLEWALGEGFASCLRVAPPRTLMSGNRVERLISAVTGIGLKKRFSREVLDSDVIVILGGDDFTEDYGYYGLLAGLLKIGAISKCGKKVILLGQSIGPFSSWRKSVARHCLRKTYIVCRDEITYNYLRCDLGLSDVFLGADLAFLPLAREENGSFFYNTNLPQSGSYATVVPSGILWRYGLKQDRNEYLECLAKICEYLLTEVAEKIVILPHSICGDRDDQWVGKDLYVMLCSRISDPSRVVFLEDELLPFQAREVLGGGKLVVTGRMHAAISALVKGVPAVALSYSRKFWGVIGQEFGRQFIIDVRDKSWEDAALGCIGILADYVLPRYDELTSWLRAKVSMLQGRALESIKMVANLIAEEKGKSKYN